MGWLDGEVARIASLLRNMAIRDKTRQKATFIPWQHEKRESFGTSACRVLSPGCDRKRQNTPFRSPAATKGDNFDGGIWIADRGISVWKGGRNAWNAEAARTLRPVNTMSGEQLLETRPKADKR